MTRRETLIAYLLSSVEAEDWHAVRDAAVDIEVLDARGQRFGVKFQPPPPSPLPITHASSCQCYACQQSRTTKWVPTP